ncbi:GIY-YIG nuclease family protein [Oscillatoria amoena NRMC-F 0135]|nr:GIY-YIG nuclease family protein [Oscillatoria amoena NRMC-F 0135]
MKQHNYFVYIVTNPGKSVLYTGITNNLCQRITEHYLNRGKQKTFAGRYYCYILIYHEQFLHVHEAIKREKEIKGWLRLKKLQLVSNTNPYFKSLNKDIMPDWPPKWGQIRNKN